MEQRNRTGLFALVVVGIVAAAAGAAFLAAKPSIAAEPAQQEAGLTKEDIGPFGT
jgi:hypothetical protein